MGKIKFGIIGIGSMGSFHIEYLKKGEVPELDLRAVCDIKASRLEWAKKELGEDIACFQSAEEMISSGLVDAILIATPHYFHPTYAMLGFKYGLHVLSEKPAGVCVKQVLEMNAAAKASKKVFGVMFNQRTNPVYKKMREIIRNGELGEITRTNWLITDWYRSQAYYDSGEWRATWADEGGGVLMNQAPHNIDLWQWICGMPDKVTAFCKFGHHHNIEVDDDVTAYVEYPNGATGVFITTTGDRPGTNRLEVCGERGKLLTDGKKLTFWKLSDSVRAYSRDASMNERNIRCDVIDVPFEADYPGHIGITKNWVDAILNGTKLIAPGEEGVNGVTLSNAMYLSTWKNKTVSIPLDPDEVWAEFEKKIATSNRKAKPGAEERPFKGVWKQSNGG